MHVIRTFMNIVQNTVCFYALTLMSVNCCCVIVCVCVFVPTKLMIYPCVNAQELYGIISKKNKQGLAEN